MTHFWLITCIWIIHFIPIKKTNQHVLQFIAVAKYWPSLCPRAYFGHMAQLCFHIWRLTEDFDIICVAVDWQLGLMVELLLIYRIIWVIQTRLSQTLSWRTALFYSTVMPKELMLAHDLIILRFYSNLCLFFLDPLWCRCECPPDSWLIAFVVFTDVRCCLFISLLSRTLTVSLMYHRIWWCPTCFQTWL